MSTSTGSFAAPRMGRRISVNATAKLAAEIVGRVAQLGLTALVARRLDETGLGIYAYGIALGFVLAQGTDLGLQLIVTREVARNEAAAPGRFAIVGAALKLKLGLSLLVLAVLAGLSTLRPEGAREPTFALGASMLLYSYVEFFGYVLRGRQQLVDEAVLVSAARVVPATLGAGLLLAGGGLSELGWTLAAASVVMALLGYGWMRTRGVMPRFERSNRAGGAQNEAGWLMRQALPLGIGIVLSILYTRVAVFLLEPLQGPGAVGVYNLAQRLYEPLQILPAALLAAVFPAFAQSIGQARGLADAALRLERQTLGLLALAGVVIAGVGVLIGPAVIGVLFGQRYVEEGGAALRLLLLAVPPMFLTYALTHFLIAVGQQRWNAVLSGIVLAVNIGLNLVLIPALGPSGAALALTLSEGVLFVLALSLWRKWRRNV